MAEGKVSVLIASKLLESGEEVYRRYPNGCVYVYRDGKYASVKSGVRESRNIDGPATLFHWVATGRVLLLEISTPTADAVLQQLAIGCAGQLTQPVPIHVFECHTQDLVFSNIDATTPVSFEFDRPVDSLAITFKYLDPQVGEFKPYSQIRDLSMDCGEWFILQ